MAFYLILDPATKSMQAYELRDAQYQLLPVSPEYEFQLHAECIVRLDSSVPFA